MIITGPTRALLYVSDDTSSCNMGMDIIQKATLLSTQSLTTSICSTHLKKEHHKSKRLEHLVHSLVRQLHAQESS